MTREEAIETLKANYPDDCYKQLREAVDVAIEALKSHDAAGETIYRQDAMDAVKHAWAKGLEPTLYIEDLPSAQPEYEPVKAEDFAKTMSENTLYSFMAWHGEALELMERQGFVICKKTM